YEVYKRTSCPPTPQPFEQTCVLGDVSLIYSGLQLTHVAGALSPYTAYDFQLQVYNDKGGVDFPLWLTVNTSESGPSYSQTPNLYKNGTLAVISWDTHSVSSRLRRSQHLVADGRFFYRGGVSGVWVDRGTDKGSEYVDTTLINFTITVITSFGQAESPVIVFDPNAVDNTGTTPKPPAPASASATPFYQEIWFIALMCVLALIILFLILVICIWRCGSRRPYMRERMPLHQPSRDRLTRRDLYVVDSRDGSIIHENV
ncbi:unnamed protein product, partial [Candidula unifasciata]